MGKITSYDIDQTPNANDKWIGTDGVTGSTRNFNIGGIADSLNVYGLIGVGAQVPFEFFAGHESVRRPGSISFPIGMGNLTAFSAVTDLVVSNKSYIGESVSEIINYLGSGNILIYDMSNVNNFARYVVSDISVRSSEPTFFDFSLIFVDGNGVFDKTKKYGVIEAKANGIEDHSLLSNIGTNSHTQIDAHIAGALNPHSVTKSQVGLSDVNNTSDLDKPTSNITQYKLDAKVDDTQVLTNVPLNALFTDTIYDSAAVDNHISSTSNPHSVNKAQVGLTNVDNTNDAGKPVSTAAQLALDAKVDDTQVLTNVPLNALFTDTIYDSTAVDNHISSTSNPHSVTKAQVGLTNVDNTNDAGKPVSTAAQLALDAKVDDTQVLTNVPLNALFTDNIYTHTIYQEEVDFGSLPIYEKEFNVANANVYPSTNIVASAAYDAGTGKDLDEATMDTLNIMCGQAYAGGFKMFIKSTDSSYLSDTFKINYSIST